MPFPAPQSFITEHAFDYIVIGKICRLDFWSEGYPDASLHVYARVIWKQGVARLVWLLLLD